MREPAKHKEVEGVLGSHLAGDAFNRLVNYGKAINDFVTEGAEGDAVRARVSVWGKGLFLMTHLFATRAGRRG